MPAQIVWQELIEANEEIKEQKLSYLNKNDS